MCIYLHHLYGCKTLMVNLSEDRYFWNPLEDLLFTKPLPSLQEAGFGRQSDCF